MLLKSKKKEKKKTAILLMMKFLFENNFKNSLNKLESESGYSFNDY